VPERRPPARRPVGEKKRTAAKKPTAAKGSTAARKPATARNPAKPGDPGRRRAVVRAALGSVVLVGLLFAFVYPTRTFLEQRSETSKARSQLELLLSENRKLAKEAKLLQSDAEIERRARAYGLVSPGERPFVIIPAPTTAPPADPQQTAP
jgi:cell division protein FtsB